MFDEFLGNALYNIYGDNSIVANENGDLFVRDPLGNDHYTTAAGTKGDWLLRKYGPDIVVRDTGGIAYARVGDGDWYIASLSRMPNTSFVSVVAPAYITNTAPKDSKVTAFVPTGEEWYYRRAEELKREHPEWTMEQITNKMSEIIWNNNYQVLINDIANSSSPEEREQKISAHQYELDKYEASGIGVTNDIQYLRKVQGMPLASMLDAIASFNNSYSYSGMESQYMYAPDHLVHSDAISAADSNTVLEHNEEHQTLWQVSVGGTPTQWQLEKAEAEQKMAESREEEFKDYIEKLRNLPFIQGASLTPDDLEAGYQLGTYDGRTYVRTRLEDGNWVIHPDDRQLAQESSQSNAENIIFGAVPGLFKVAAKGGGSLFKVFQGSSKAEKLIDGINVVEGKVGGKIPIEEFTKIRGQSIHNAEANSIILGKYTPTVENGVENWAKAGPDSYIAKAGDKSTYFDLGSEWSNIQKRYNLTRDEMFNYFNKPALDDAVKSGKTIQFSHDPRLYSDSYLADEWKYLKETYGYKTLIRGGDGWIAK